MSSLRSTWPWSQEHGKFMTELAMEELNVVIFL